MTARTGRSSGLPLATVMRGVRARALLSVGSVLLLALAIGSAVLGPTFASAGTNSYLVSRLGDAPNLFSGLTWTMRPDAAVRTPAQAMSAATDAVARYASDPFRPATATLQTARVPTTLWNKAHVRLLTRPGVCAHLRLLSGRCPSRPDEIAIRDVDQRNNGVRVGQRLDLGALGARRVVAVYAVSGASERYWFDLGRLLSLPPRTPPRGPSTPYQPAPFVTAASAFDDVPTDQWQVVVDSRFDARADITPADLDRGVSIAKEQRATPLSVEAGTLAPGSTNGLGSLVKEVRGQKRTAARSVAPAVISLVLVALALLLRLLTAAGELRQPELALASLRGVTGRRLWTLGLAEPLLLVLVSLPLGIGIGAGGGVLLVRWWLVPGLPVPFPAASAVACAAVVLAAVGIVGYAVSRVLRVTLAEQLAGVRRPRASSRPALVATLALVAVAVAALASKLTSGGRRGDPDVVDLVLPVLLAVVAGLGASRLIAWVAARWVRRRPRSRSLAGFVSRRAIARRTEATMVVLPLTAAIAVTIFGAGVYSAASSWRQSVAATAAPAAQVWQSKLSMEQTVALTHGLDPRGRYLMAAGTALYADGTLSIVDAPRLARVAEWPGSWLPGDDAAGVARKIGPRGTVPVLSGSSLSVDASVVTANQSLGDKRSGSQSDPASGNEQLPWLTMTLEPAGAPPTTVSVGPFGPGTTSRSAAMPCRQGCRLVSMTVGRAAGLPVQFSGSIDVRGIKEDGKEVSGAITAAGWSGAGAPVRNATVNDGVLHVVVDMGTRSTTGQVLAAVEARRPVLVGREAGGTVRGSGAHTHVGTTEGALPVREVDRAESTPFLGPGGVLIDYTSLAVGHSMSGNVFESYVLARPDTPAAMERNLADRLSPRTGYAATLHTLDSGAYALALRLYAVVGVLVLLMALAGLAVSTAVQLPARRRDAASLRVVGLRRRTVLAAVAREIGVVLGGAAVAGIVAGVVSELVVLRTVRLGYVEGLTTPRLLTRVDWPWLVVVVLACAAVLGVVAFVTGALTVRGARGSTLRENAR